MTRRMLNLLHSISASSKHLSQKELASAVNMSARHIENLDFFFLDEKIQEPSSGWWSSAQPLVEGRAMAGGLLCLCKRAVCAGWREDGVWPSGWGLPKHCHGHTGAARVRLTCGCPSLSRELVLGEIRGKRDGYSCLWSCRRMAWLLGELCADFPLCRNEGQQEEDAWPLGWWCAAEGWPEHWKALQVPIGTAQHLLACCRFTSAQLCWVPMAALLGVGPKMGLRCSCRLSAGKEGRPHSAGTRRWHSYCNLCEAAALE